uniref:plasminogen-binding protein PgbB n=1 Tax=Helicobacter pylori TaxID=210 RepID=UPI003464F401
KRGYVIEVDLNDFDSYNVYKTPTIGSFKFFSSNRLDKGVFYDKNRVYYDRYYLDYNDFKPKLYPVVEKSASKKSQKGEKGNAPIYLQERHKAKEKPLEENKVKPRNSGFEEEEVKTRRPEPIKDQNNAIQKGVKENQENKNAPALKESNEKGAENAPVSKEDNAIKEAPKLSPKEEKRRLKEEKKKAKAEQRAREFEQRAREHQERDEKELEERRKALEMNKK